MFRTVANVPNDVAATAAIAPPGEAIRADAGLSAPRR